MKRLILLLLQCTAVQIGFSQSCPPNLDFELGNFTGWQCSVGTTSSDGSKNNISLTNSPPVAGRHEIISESTPGQMDPYGNFPKLCPYGGKYSVKLGNENIGGESEGLSYTFQIPALVDTFTFTYFYAVVFEDPNHPVTDQPRFFVTAYDVLSGDLINCASYDYIATSGLPGFTPSPSQPGVLYKNWSPVSIQFAGLANRSVRLEFKTADCTQGGHFGYAYVDVGTGCSNILATAPYCIETNAVTLNAPYGFQSYTWFNDDYSTVVGSGQTLTISPAPASSGSFHVDMIPYPGFGCRDTATATVLPLAVPDTPVALSEISYCQYSSPTPVTAQALPGHDLLWYTTETGGIPETVAPVPPLSLPDTFTYYVTQKKLFGCESFRKKITVIIHPTPTSSFTLNDVRQCEKGNEFICTNTSVNLYNSDFYWDFGDGMTDSSGNSVIRHSYTTYGNYSIRLKVINTPVCANESVQHVTLMPKPVAAFKYPPLICEQQANIALRDVSFVPSGSGVINRWNWNINDSSITSQHPFPFNANDRDSLKIGLSVITNEGCLSDTIKQALPVRRRPIADFEYASSLCENRIVEFRDQSRMPQGGAGEFIRSWNWEVDDIILFDNQHPRILLSSGVHRAKLVSETNYGCRSLPQFKQFAVHPKPAIGLDINDSCVFRTIRYRAVDLHQSVSRWRWDFGNGLRDGAATVSRTYSKEGYYPLTLVGETVNGCQDTIPRPFTIYDNKAYAGKDTTVARGEPVQLNAGGGPAMQYFWSPADGLTSTSIEKPVAILDRDQLYTLYAITPQGCDSRSKIFIKRYKGPDIYIPNAFSPNADGRNDALVVFPVGIRSFISLSVYNRYGHQVYHSGDQAKGWDGTLKGMRQDAGTYVVVSKAIDYTGKLMVKKASVVLIR